jgi:glycine cleavage system protein P-like pyridoxal-binding family
MHTSSTAEPFISSLVAPCCAAGALPAFESDEKTFGTMAAAPFGSSLILPISYAYIALMGSEGLTEVCACSAWLRGHNVWLLQPVLSGPLGCARKGP